jgi:quinol monooxygenase YgiN
MHTISVKIVAKPESVQKVSDLLAEASKIYEKDSMTINWFVNQSTTVETEFQIVELFDNDVEAVKQHRENPFFLVFRERIKDLVESIEVHRWRSIEGTIIDK